jgi:tetratricopeptide (TPR) repeat protein
MYKSLILAVWFKKHLKENIINRLYADKKKVNGVDTVDAAFKEKVYNQYLASFRQGAYNYIQSQRIGDKIAKRAYFSGGLELAVNPSSLPLTQAPQGTTSADAEVAIALSDANGGDLKGMDADNVLRGLSIGHPDGSQEMYVNHDDLESQLPYFAKRLGIPLEKTNIDIVKKFIDGHETFHTFMRMMRARGIKLHSIDEIPGEENRLADLLGKVFALGYGEVSAQAHEELELLSTKLNFNLADVLSRNPRSTEALLEKLGINIKIEVVKNHQELIDIRTKAKAAGYDVKSAIIGKLNLPRRRTVPVDDSAVSLSSLLEQLPQNSVKDVLPNSYKYGQIVPTVDNHQIIYYPAADTLSLADIAQAMGMVSMSPAQAQKFFFARQVFIALLSKNRNDSAGLRGITFAQEDRLADLFGRVFAFGPITVKPVMLNVLKAVGKAMGFDDLPALVSDGLFGYPDFLKKLRLDVGAEQMQDDFRMSCVFDDSGKALYDARRYREAATVWENAAMRRPCFTFYYEAGFAAEESGDETRAIRNFVHAFEISSDFSSFAREAGKRYSIDDKKKKEEIDADVAKYKARIQSNPRDSLAYFHLGCVSIAAEGINIEYFRKAGELNPKNVLALYYLFLRSNDAEKVIAELTAMISSNPMGFLYRQRARKYLQLGKTNEAVADLLRAVELGSGEDILKDSYGWMRYMSAADVDRILADIYLKDPSNTTYWFSRWAANYPNRGRICALLGITSEGQFNYRVNKVGISSDVADGVLKTLLGGYLPSASTAKTKKVGDAIQGLAVEYKDREYPDHIYINRSQLAAYMEEFKRILGEDVNETQIIHFIEAHEGFHSLINKLRRQGRDLLNINEDDEESIGDIFGAASMFRRKGQPIPSDLFRELSIISRYIGIDLIGVLRDHPDTIEGLMEKLGVKVTVEAKTPAEMEAIKAQAERNGHRVKAMTPEEANNIANIVVFGGSPLWLSGIGYCIYRWAKASADEDSFLRHTKEFCDSHKPRQIAATMYRYLESIKRGGYGRHKEHIEFMLKDMKDWIPLLSDRQTKIVISEMASISPYAVLVCFIDI